MALVVADDGRITLLLNIKCHHCMHNHKEANTTNVYQIHFVQQVYQHLIHLSRIESRY